MEGGESERRRKGERRGKREAEERGQASRSILGEVVWGLEWLEGCDE